MGVSIRNLTVPFIALLASFLVGCANLNTVYRPLDIHGKAVAIDGYQTPIFSTEIDIVLADGTTRRRVAICANPPVDAITANSVGAGAANALTGANTTTGTTSTTGGSNNTQAALSSAQTAASIGLRTNSTTLLSYNSAANCLAFMGGATLDPGFMALARRNQNITLGTLAIEQLTGVAQAGQATLNGTAAAGTGSDSTSAQAADVDTAKKAVADAQNTQASKKLAVDNAIADKAPLAQALTDANNTLSNLPATAAADQKTAAQNNVSQAKANVTAQGKVIGSAQVDLDNQTRLVQVALDAETEAENALAVAKSAVKSAATANAQIAGGGGPHSSATAEVAAQVRGIVQDVLSASEHSETCNDLVQLLVKDFIRNPSSYAEGTIGSALMKSCLPPVSSTNPPFFYREKVDIPALDGSPQGANVPAPANAAAPKGPSDSVNGGYFPYSATQPLQEAARVSARHKAKKKVSNASPSASAVSAARVASSAGPSTTSK